MGLKRNVAVAIGNWLASNGPPAEAVTVLWEALEEEPLVRDHAAWAMGVRGGR